MTARLSVIEGPAQGEDIVVPIDGLTLGRASPTVGGRLRGDVGLSRRHARIRILDDGSLIVEDLNSTNGTYVNDEPVHGLRTVEAGDVLRFGESLVQVVETDSRGETLVAPRSFGAPATHGAVVIGGGIRAEREGVAAGRDIHGGVHRQTVTAGKGGSAAGRDIYHQEQYYDPSGFGLMTQTGGLPRVLFTIGVLVGLAGFGIAGYSMFQVFGNIDPGTSSPPGPGPLLPLGIGLFFAGMVIMVIGQLSIRRGRD